MKKLEFIKDLEQQNRQKVYEGLSYEDALLYRLEKMTESPVQEYTKGQDKVTMDVPLLLRIMEYAKEDAKSDLDLHHVADKLIELSINGKVLTMDDYNSIVRSVTEPQDQTKISAPESIDLSMLKMLAGVNSTRKN
jgi:hypothetical protein